MITKVLKTIEAYQMLSPDSAVVAGVSGGADSMALLHVLQSRRKDWPELKVTAAHVNHCLRGAEADRDEEHVRRYCQREGIPLEVLKIDVREEAAKRKLGLEACGRAVRYEFFPAAGRGKRSDRHGPHPFRFGGDGAAPPDPGNRAQGAVRDSAGCGRTSSGL